MEDINVQLLESIFSISRLMKEKMASHSELASLTFLQIQTLAFVGKNKSVHMSDIAESFKIELPSATSLIQKLVKAGFIQREEDAKDRRIVKIFLTNQGKKLLKTLIAHREQKIKSYLSLLSGGEKKQLLGILRKMITKMEEHNEK